MKIRIEMDENITEEEIVIRCSELTDEIKEIQNLLNEKMSKNVIRTFTLLIAASLASLGLYLIFKRDSMGFYVFKDGHLNTSSKEDIVKGEDGSMSIETAFKETCKRVELRNFTKADVKCDFGVVKLYFQDAELASSEAYINIELSIFKK